MTALRGERAGHLDLPSQCAPVRPANRRARAALDRAVVRSRAVLVVIAGLMAGAGLAVAMFECLVHLG